MLQTRVNRSDGHQHILVAHCMHVCVIQPDGMANNLALHLAECLQGYVAWRGFAHESELPQHVLDFLHNKFTVHQVRAACYFSQLGQYIVQLLVACAAGWASCATHDWTHTALQT